MDGCNNNYAWKEIPQLLCSGDLDPETNDIVHKLSVVFSDSIKTGNELKPVFGARELDETHFILNAEELKQSRDDIMECTQNQDINDKVIDIRNKVTRSRHNTSVQDEPKNQNKMPDIDEAYIPLLEVPKGIHNWIFDR